MPTKKEVKDHGEKKILSNRFDCYQISHFMSESTQELLEKSYQPVQTKIMLRSIIGVILAVNAYLSHWGPWPWPDNYYLILGSIFVYHIGCRVYSKLSPVENCEGNFIGEYEYKGNRTIFTMKISDSMTDYTLELIDSASKKSIAEKTFVYFEYFTEKGVFLEDRFQKHLSGFLGNVSKK